MNDGKTDQNKPLSPFPQTTDSIWERIQKAGDGDLSALGELCLIYQRPILIYVMKWQPNRHQAEDLTQSFIARILEKNLFQQFERRESRFRSFLVRCLRRFLTDEWRKKDPDWEECDENLAENGKSISTFDLALAWEIHEQVLSKLTDDYALPAEKRERFAKLQRFIIEREESYAELASPLQMTSVYLRKFVHDLREAHHDAYRRAVAQLVSREELSEEMPYLMGLLAYPKPSPD